MTLLRVRDDIDWRNITPGSLVALDQDGLYAAPPNAPRQINAADARWITVYGNYRASSIVDWEPGNPVYTSQGLRRFVRGRRYMQEEAITYLDRADAHDAWMALTEGTDTNLRDYTMWWIATLDNTLWSPQQLAEDLAVNWGAPIPASKIWANQNVRGINGQPDVSNLFLPFR